YQAPTTYTATVNVTEGIHEVKVEYFEWAGGAVAQLDWELHAEPATCASGQFRADFYANTTLRSPIVLSRCEDRPISHNWGSGSPDPVVPADHFSANWVGQFEFADGEYTFTA